MLSSLALLFTSAFFAATLIPAQSEAMLSAMLVTGPASPVLLVAVASLGNTLGAMLNWALGRYAQTFRDRRWFPLSVQSLDRAAGWYARYGRWSLLASWVPFIGDPLTLAAGLLREPLWRFILVVGAAKTARYVVLAWLVLRALGR